jgi:pyridoxal phosphate enzyme (YggS family)
MERIAANLARVRERIASAAARAKRAPSEVTLIAVSKTRTPAEIEAACEAGVRHVGENRVEEAEDKQPHLDLPGVTWHMIGHLQSRKARRAIECFDIVHSVDSSKLARKLDRLAAERDMVLPVLIEINVSGEPSKYGLALSDRTALASAVSEIVSLDHLSVEGLMTVAFIAHDPEEVRPVFAGLRTLRDELAGRYPQGRWTELSMGMTDDFEVAVEEGATMVRIGRAIFGPRHEE